MLNVKERELHELNFQINPITREIPLEEKEAEYKEALIQKEYFRKGATNNYISRGPSNLGGRTRAVVVDLSDNTGNTIIAGGVSSGVFKTTNGGSSWSKVSSNGEIHNVTTIAQDPRSGFQNVWYYGTGEWSGNSASLGSPFRGEGIWKSTDSGTTWSQIPGSASVFTDSDSFFDYVNKIVVSPTTGDVFIATTGKIYRYNGTSFNVELELEDNDTGWTDVVVAANGRVFASLEGNSKFSGVHTSATGNGSWSRIARSGVPSGWSPTGRIVLGTAPSNNDVIYALYVNGQSGSIEADLWKYNFSSSTWIDLSSKLPDEPGGDSPGNDPFAVQGGYDLVVSVKPDDENFVILGGVNIYKIENILTDSMFQRIGGYVNNQSYGLYNVGGVDHHPDIHAITFSPFDSKVLYSGTDGGVHKTDVTLASTAWENLNNDYVTYQYYHVALDPKNNSDIVLGGAQDNGTTMGGLNAGLPNKSDMDGIAGGDGVAVAIGSEISTNNPRLFLGTQRGPIYRFTGGFSRIQPIQNYDTNNDPVYYPSQFVTYFYLDPDNTNALYYASESRLLITNDADNVDGDSWTDAGFIPTSENIRTMATTRGTYDVNNSYLYIGGALGGVFRLKDPQNATSAATAVNITPSTATTASNTIVSGIGVHPTNPDIVYAAIELDRKSGAVYRSEDRGESWKKMSNTVSGGTGSATTMILTCSTWNT